MEETPNPIPTAPPPEVEPSSKSTKLFTPLNVIIAFVILLFVGGFAAFFFFRKSDENPKSSQEIEGTAAITIAHEKNGSIYVYDPKAQKMSQTPVQGISTGKYGGAAGLGSTEIFTSPDMTMSAIIDSTTHDLFILDHKSHTPKRITKSGDVDYITGWTKNNKNLLYYRSAPDPVSGDPTSTNGGFYLLDLSTWESKKLEGIESAEALSNNKILTSNGGKFALYDIITGTSDPSPFSGDYTTGFFHQIDLTPDATHWVFVRAQTEYAGDSAGKSEMYYADIGKDTGTLIAQGAFAEIQFPLISPSDDKVVYRSGKNGIPDTVIVVDVKTNSEVSRTSGNKPTWIDNDQILITTYQNQAEFHSYSIWNTVAGEITADLNSLIPKSAYEVVDTSEFPGGFVKRRSDIKASIEGIVAVPKEFEESYESNLVGLSCNTFNNYEGKGWEYSAKYSDDSEYSKHLLTDEGVISIIEKTNDLTSYSETKKASPYVTVCKLDDTRLYIERSAEFDAYAKPHAFIWSNNEFTHIAQISYSGEPMYSGCSILQITKSQEFFYRCGTGDGGYSAFEIQKIIPGSTPEVLFICEFSAGGPAKCTEGPPKPSVLPEI